MIKAYHMIGATASADLLHKIISSKSLRPIATQSGRPTRMFALDRLAGDDKFIFLSVGRRYWQETDNANFGFIFDAETLLRQGGILRTADLLSQYEDLLDEVVSQYTPDRKAGEWSEAERAMLEAALADPEAYPHYQSPNDAYYDLISAVENSDMSVPQTPEATRELQTRMTELQTKCQFTGQVAIHKLKENPQEGQYEILVKERLPVSLATAYIKAGQEVPTGRGGARKGSGRKPKALAEKRQGLALTHYWSADLVELARNCLMLEAGRDITDEELRQFLREAAITGVETTVAQKQAALAKLGTIVTPGAIIM